MDGQWCNIKVIFCVIFIFAITHGSCDESNEVNKFEVDPEVVQVNVYQSPLYRFYLEWVAEKLRKGELLTSGEQLLYTGLLEKTDRGEKLPALELYFIYKVNRNKCGNSGDEDCMDGSVSGSGSNGGLLNDENSTEN